MPTITEPSKACSRCKEAKSVEPISSIMFNLQALRSSDARRLWRRRIFERDGFRCVYCGSSEDLTLDHVKSKFHGGQTVDGNVVTCCRYCNQLKGSMSLEEFILTYA